MYRRDIAHLPSPIERSEYVRCIFELGWRHDHSAETMMNAVLLGDYFVSYSGIRTPYHLFSLHKSKLLEKVVPPVYSIELSHVVSVLSAKLNEDRGYDSIKVVASETQNYVVYKMEWEICFIVQFNIRRPNIISSWALIVGPEKNHLGSWMWDLTLEICLNESLLAQSPLTILLALKLLARRNKLGALYRHDERIFELAVKEIAWEYEISTADLLKLYISRKRVR